VAVLLKLVALVVPLGLDTFAVAAALGLSGLPRRDRLRVSLLFTGFEAGMPLIGVLAGGLVGRALGGAAEVVAIILLVALGAFMLRPGKQHDDEPVPRLDRTRGLAAIGLGISISTDELAIGFTLGLLGLPILPVIILIGVQTFLVTQAGIRLGARVGKGFREGAERVAGVVLIVLGLVLLGERIFH
jgi:manganese efflux pump family protein